MNSFSTLSLSFLKIFILREREKVSMSRERERESEADSAPSLEPDARLDLTSRRSRPELKPRVRCLTTEPPRHPHF